MTQEVALKNRTVATPRVTRDTEETVVLDPAIYVVVVEQVIVTLPDVLLTSTTTFPAENTLLGIVTDPPDPI